MKHSRKYAAAFYAFLALMLVAPALAQLPVPTPQAPAAVKQVAAPVKRAPSVTANVPDFDANVDASRKPVEEARDYVDENGILRSPDGSVKMDARAMRETVELHDKERKIEVAQGGFDWMSWERAGAKVHEFIFERSEDLKKDVALTKGAFFDIAVTDVDHDKQPDIIVWQWNNCGNRGCLYTVVYGNKVKSPETFIGFVVRPYKNGITVDGGYFGL